MNHEIRLGFTFEYFILGVLLIAVGGPVCIASLAGGIGMIILGISLLLLRTGIQVNADKRCVRKYYELFAIRLGSWIDVSRFPNVLLSMTNESQTIRHRGGQTTTRTKTYDLSLSDGTGSKIELNDFRSYDIAVKAMTLMTETLKLKAENKISETQQLALKRRRERRRI